MAPSLKAAIDQIRHAGLSPFKTHIVSHIRLINTTHSDGLGFSLSAQSRFSHPDSVSPGFGVIYAGGDLSTSVAETIVRDKKDGQSGQMLLSYEAAMSDWRAIILSSVSPLNLMNLTGIGLVKFGIPTDIVRQKSQIESRELAAAIHENSATFDGILFGSRFTTGQCLAVFDRGIAKLRIDEEIELKDMETEMGPVYRSMNISVLPPR